MGESFGGKLRMAFRLGVAVSAPHRTTLDRSGLHRIGTDRTTRGRRGAALAVTLSALLSVGLLGACSGQQPASAPQPNPTVAAPSQSAGDAGSSDPTPTAKPSLPPDPKAPSKVQPVGRTGSGSSSGKRVKATSVSSFDAAVKWKDGIRLQVVGVEQGVTNGVGAGSSQGAPMTSFELKLTNSSTKPVELSAVVLTAVYGGKSKLVAQPVYAQAGASDFSGTVAPGKSATATYVYTIPTKQLGAVSLFVDLDGRHAIGSFTGSAR